MHLARWLTFGLLVAGVICADSQTPASPDPRLQHRSYPVFDGVPLEPRCADIEQMGTAFKPLANVCEYALSPQSLPNLTCEETTRRFTGSLPLDLVEDRVTFYQGHDSYSDFVVNGIPTNNFFWKGGWGSDALFGSLLHAIFLPKLETKFKLGPTKKNDSIEFRSFAYFMPKSRAPGFNVGLADPSMSGSIWIETKTNQLARVEMQATRINHASKLRSYHAAIDYGNVPITQLGSVLLPVKAAVQVCFNQGSCNRNIVYFHDCQKFASTARILTKPVQ